MPSLEFPGTIALVVPDQIEPGSTEHADKIIQYLEADLPSAALVNAKSILATAESNPDLSAAERVVGAIFSDCLQLEAFPLATRALSMVTVLESSVLPGQHEEAGEFKVQLDPVYVASAVRKEILRFLDQGKSRAACEALSFLGLRARAIIISDQKVREAVEHQLLKCLNSKGGVIVRALRDLIVCFEIPKTRLAMDDFQAGFRTSLLKFEGYQDFQGMGELDQAFGFGA